MSGKTEVIDTTKDAWIIQSALEILENRLSKKNYGSDVFSKSEDVKNFLTLQFAEEEREHFGCMFLTAQNKMLAFEKLFSGTLRYCSVHPREIVKRALQLNASALILAHNHPGGGLHPSPGDIATTKTIQEALALVDIAVHDHIIISGRECYSFYENNQIEQITLSLNSVCRVSTIYT